MYLQAVVDNYSRYVLDWKISADISVVNTRDLLLSALAQAKILGDVGKPEVFSDGGPKNDNAGVAGLGALGLFTLTLAQIDVTFSNSLIEALFRSAKHIIHISTIMPLCSTKPLTMVADNNIILCRQQKY
jgi:putative transposase